MANNVTQDVAPLPQGVSVVVPVFNSDETLTALVHEVSDVLNGIEHEIVLVDDGSADSTWQRVRKLAETTPQVVGLRLGRNVGQHNALVAGVRAARFDRVVTMDDDLQNPPEEIPKLLSALAAGDVDVVYGVAPAVAHSRWRRFSSTTARRMIASTLGGDNARDMTSFRAFRTRLRDAFAGEVGPSVSLDALLAWGTSRFGRVDVDHHPRQNGRSGYTLRKLLRYGIDTATGYSALPLQAATSIGLLAALFGVGVLVYVLVTALVGGRQVPGFAFLASIITIFAGVQLMTLGVIGEYLARMHFRVMRKPTYVVREQVGQRDREPRE